MGVFLRPVLSVRSLLLALDSRGRGGKCGEDPSINSGDVELVLSWLDLFLQVSCPVSKRVKGRPRLQGADTEGTVNSPRGFQCSQRSDSTNTYRRSGLQVMSPVVPLGDIHLWPYWCLSSSSKLRHRYYSEAWSETTFETPFTL